MRLSIIVAVADNGVLGNNNALPWHLPADLQYFKRLTLGKPIVMGRKTHESIGRPLPGRTNIVVSRSPHYCAEGVEVTASLPEALELAASIAGAGGQRELMVIGGAAIYALAIPLADRLYITEIHSSPEGDVYLPEVDWSQWREISREHHSAEALKYSFVVYQRCGEILQD
jgi:dihydrofolate reductase